MKKSPLAEALATPIKDARRGSTRCSVGQKLDDLSTADCNVVQAALDNQRWSTNSLMAALAGQGISLAYASLSRHRKRGCNCYREQAS